MPAVVEEFGSTLNALGEPTLASLGLGGYWPIGLLQSGLELIHVTTGLPWWGTIAVSTAIIRTLITPAVVLGQRNSANMANSMPGMQEINDRVAEAKQMGDNYALTQAQQELSIYMKRNGCNPLKSMYVIGISAPVFMSFFFGIRGMVNAPVEALKSGGLLWFPDLTVSDPFFVLPAVTCATLWLTIKLNSDGSVTQVENSGMVSLLMKTFPLIMFPFMMKFPAAIGVYWASSNLWSLIQVSCDSGRLFLTLDPRVWSSFLTAFLTLDFEVV